MTSDHSPVFGTFEVGVTSQFVSKKGASELSKILHNIVIYFTLFIFELLSLLVVPLSFTSFSFQGCGYCTI